MTTPNNQGVNTEERKKVVIFGGNGYVGQSMIRRALERGLHVISINRSGGPKDFESPKNSHGKVDWLKGDLNKPEEWKDAIRGADSVISCVGVIQGSDEFMEKINGDANIQAINEAKSVGIPRFVYVSACENNLPESILAGYFRGKRKAENALQQSYGDNGASLRPGFIYGTRVVPVPTIFGVKNPLFENVRIPLWILGRPIELITSTSPVKFLRENVPWMQAVLAPPVSTENLAKVGVAFAEGKIPNRPNGIFTIEDIQKFSKDL